jgi:hypothetical protein
MGGRYCLRLNYLKSGIVQGICVGVVEPVAGAYDENDKAYYLDEITYSSECVVRIMLDSIILPIR